MRHSVAAAFLIFLACTGCSRSHQGENGITVTGSVSVNGNRLDSGDITIQPKKGPGDTLLQSKISLDGSFKIVSVPEGESLVVVRAFRETDETVMVYGQEEPQKISLIPKKHRNGFLKVVSTKNSHWDIDIRGEQ